MAVALIGIPRNIKIITTINMGNPKCEAIGNPKILNISMLNLRARRMKIWDATRVYAYVIIYLFISSACLYQQRG